MGLGVLLILVSSDWLTCLPVRPRWCGNYLLPLSLLVNARIEISGVASLGDLDRKK